MKYYIIGGGITGLTIAHCLHHNGIPKENIKIYTKDVGGQVKNNIYLGPRILEKNSKTTAFVKSLGTYIRSTEFSIGYLHDNNTITSSFTEDERQIYCLKTERDCSESTMSAGKTFFEGWNWEDIDLLNTLSLKYASTIEIKDINADEIKQLSKEKNTIVISTVNLFHKPNPDDIQKISFFESSETFTSLYSYVYDLRRASKIKRINFGKKTIYEVHGDVKELGDRYKHIATLPQIYSNNYYEKEGDIFLEGRFARLQHSCKLENVIERWF